MNNGKSKWHNKFLIYYFSLFSMIDKLKGFVCAKNYSARILLRKIKRRRWGVREIDLQRPRRQFWAQVHLPMPFPAFFGSNFFVNGQQRLWKQQKSQKNAPESSFLTVLSNFVENIKGFLLLMTDSCPQVSSDAGFCTFLTFWAYFNEFLVNTALIVILGAARWTKMTPKSESS